MPADVLVFDVDGVLVDVTASYRETIRQTVRQFTGRDITNAAIQDLKNTGGWNNDWEVSHKFIRDFGGNVPYGDVVEAFQKLFFGCDGVEGLILRERWIAAPGLLERLAERYQLAIFTGRLQIEIDSTLARCGNGLCFDPIVTVEHVKDPKPAPEGLFLIAERHAEKRLWYVGDSVDDARSARAARVPFIGIASPANPRSRDLACLLTSEGAIAVLDDINQLETVLP